MTRGKQKLEAQKKNAEKNQKAKGSQIEPIPTASKSFAPFVEASVGELWSVAGDLDNQFLVYVPVCLASDRMSYKNLYDFYLKILDQLFTAFYFNIIHLRNLIDMRFNLVSQAQLANQNQLVDHYGSKHPKEKPPSNSG
ncbi:hypothetical protein AAHA92_00765 [Salvia divinorum]|uniref:Small EDRK-rich factor-like N-terminal domain-containing protein n=1 Tax=Salvia divinorum TaxID=28513 RepID=A0ABD1IKN8_SALDI